MALLKLKATGKCEIEVPEWLYDMDSPGQYMRRIKSVAISIPCIVGPYTGRALQGILAQEQHPHDGQTAGRRIQARRGWRGHPLP
jgi:hypothetical protein